MRNAGELLRAVDELYAAVSTGAWSPAIEAVTDVLGGDHAFLHVTECDAGAALVSARVSQSDLVRMLSPEAMRLAQPVLHTYPDGFFDRRALMSDAEFVHSAYYNELIRPIGGFHSIAANQAGSGFVLAVCRGPADGAFGSDDLAQLARLAPHLATALALHQRLHAAQWTCESLAGMLDRIRTGTILTDADARPIFVNSSAWQVLNDDDGLQLRTGGLAASAPAATRRLRAAIAAAAGRTVGSRMSKPDFAAGLAPEREQTLRLPRPSQRLALSVTVLPIGRLGMSLSGLRKAQVAVFVSEPDSPPRIDRAALAEAFRLTRRESETVALLAVGCNLEQIATTLGISVSSVRQYFKRAFDKTGTHSQAALVALARGFVEP